MKKIFFFAILSLTFSGCLRLDDNLYAPQKVTTYERDNYTGDQDFILDASYKIPDSLIHEFTLNSQAGYEASATEIYAEYIGSLAHIATDTVIMYCHGNFGHMDFYWQRAKLLANTGWKDRYGVLMIDYRGYGRSKGKETEDGLYTDVDAALTWLKQHGLTNSRLVMYGFSMGTAPATKLTAEPRSMIPSKLILEAPFASAEVMVQDGSQLAMPGSFMTNLKINNAEEIKSVQQPFLWMHGIKDAFLSITTHGEVVFKNYHGVRGVAVRVPEAGHSSVPQTMGFKNYNDTLASFIGK